MYRVDSVSPTCRWPNSRAECVAQCPVQLARIAETGVQRQRRRRDELRCRSRRHATSGVWQWGAGAGADRRGPYRLLRSLRAPRLAPPGGRPAPPLRLRGCARCARTAAAAGAGIGLGDERVVAALHPAPRGRLEVDDDLLHLLGRHLRFYRDSAARPRRSRAHIRLGLRAAGLPLGRLRPLLRAVPLLLLRAGEQHRHLVIQTLLARRVRRGPRSATLDEGWRQA